MSKKIIIDPAHGGSDIGISNDNINEKELTLLIANYIYNKLKDQNIPVKLTRNKDILLTDENRINTINTLYNPNEDVIVVSIEIVNTNKGTDIIYALRNNNKLATMINNKLLENDITVNEYYQRRLPGNTSLDYDYLIRNTNPNESLIIQFDMIDDYKNFEKYAEAIANALVDYINMENIKQNTYTVKSGDSLYSIASRFNTSVSNLKTLNNLSSNLLSIGQILKIPSSDSSNNTYTVKSGDSLYSIASRFNTSVSNLKALNNLSSNLLSIGQILKIPSSDSSNNTYTVKKGDSLYSIASKFNTTVNAIKSLNNLSSNSLSIGQVLKIPSSDSSNNTYTVKKGDSLYSIASKFNTTVNAIKSLNNISSNLLSIGQILKIPK